MKNNLAASRILHVAFVEKCEKRTNHMSLPAHPAKHAWLLSFLVISSLDANGEYKSKSGRIRLSLRDSKWKKFSECNNCTWKKTPYSAAEFQNPKTI